MSSELDYNLLNNLVSSVMDMDMLIKEWLQVRQFAWLLDFLGFITYFGSPLVLIPISLLVFIWLGWHRRWLEVLTSYTCLLSAWLLTDYLKHFFARPRPLGETFTVAAGFAFPSGHAALSMAYYGFLATLLISPKSGRRHRLAAAGLLVLISCIGFSRIYLNVHYFSDVLAGLVLGWLVLLANRQGMRWIKNRK